MAAKESAQDEQKREIFSTRSALLTVFIELLNINWTNNRSQRIHMLRRFIIS